MQVKDMTVEQLRDLIRHTVEQCLEEYSTSGCYEVQ